MGGKELPFGHSLYSIHYSFNQSLDGFEMRVLAVAHQLEEGHFEAGRDGAAEAHFLQANISIGCRACGDAVGEQMHLTSAGQKIVDSLIDADVRFQATDHELSRGELSEILEELRGGTATECGFLKDGSLGWECSEDFLCGVSQAFWVLLGEEERDLKKLCCLKESGNAGGDGLEIHDDFSECFLDVDDEQGCVRGIEGVGVHERRLYRGGGHQV